MVAEPYGAAARTTTSTRRTRRTRNSKADKTWLWVTALLLLTALSASRILVEHAKLCKPQEARRFKKKGTWYKVKLQDVDLRKQIRLKADPEILWKSEVFAVEDPHTVEVHCPWHWKLREIQVRESPRSEEAEEVDQWLKSEEEEKSGIQNSLQGVREELQRWKRKLEEGILYLRKQVQVKKTLAAMTEATFQSIQESLQSLVSVQRSQQWGKHRKTGSLGS